MISSFSTRSRLIPSTTGRRSRRPPDCDRSSGVTRLQWARVQVFQKGPLFPKKNFKKQRRANFGPPTALGPRALHALHALLLRQWIDRSIDRSIDRPLCEVRPKCHVNCRKESQLFNRAPGGGSQGVGV